MSRDLRVAPRGKPLPTWSLPACPSSPLLTTHLCLPFQPDLTPALFENSSFVLWPLALHVPCPLRWDECYTHTPTPTPNPNPCSWAACLTPTYFPRLPKIKGISVSCPPCLPRPTSPSFSTCIISPLSAWY